MKVIRIFGLAAVAAIAAMAFLGAAAAQAAPDEISVCKLNLALCPEGESYPEGTTILALATKPILLGLLNEECETSHAEYKIGGPNNSLGMGDPLELTPVLLSFSGNCKPCTTVTASLIGNAKIREDASGDYILTGTGKATLSGCPLGLSCTFEGKNSELLITNQASGLALIHAEKEVLTRTAGSAFCGSTGEWDALYLVETPHPAWIALTADLRPGSSNL